MSTRCQIEFKSGSARRTVYRHWDGYPGAVLPDLLSFLAWSTRGGDVEYEAANFLFWSKRELDERSQQLGFGVCQNDELHGDIEYYYLVEHTERGVVVRAFEIDHDDGPRIGRCVDSLAVPAASFFNSSSPAAGVQDFEVEQYLRYAFSAWRSTSSSPVARLLPVPLPRGRDRPLRHRR